MSFTISIVEICDIYKILTEEIRHYKRQNLVQVKRLYVHGKYLQKNTIFLTCFIFG